MLVAKVGVVRKTLELHPLDLAAARRFIDEAPLKDLDHLWVKEVLRYPMLRVNTYFSTEIATT